MSTETTQAAPTELFDRYLLPKAALSIILVASLLGTWVSLRLVGQASTAGVAAKWAYFVALGVVTGGFLWKHAFVRPADLDADDGAYCARMFARFDWIAGAAAVVLAVGGTYTLLTYRALLGSPQSVQLFAVLLAGSVGLVGLATLSGAGVAAQYRRPLGLAALASLLGLVATTAVVEVTLRGYEPTPAAVRVLHLLAFAVWIGGAVWNIFVAVPTGKRRPTTAVVRAAGEQLERFRWAVRLIIPTLLLTGAYQSVDALGRHVGPYLETTIGLAIAAKLGTIGVLVAIFFLCPMWRACSPIEGVCELEDLDGTAGGADTAAPGDRAGSCDPHGTSDAPASGDGTEVPGDD